MRRNVRICAGTERMRGMITERTVYLEEPEYGRLIDFDEAARYLGYGGASPTEEIRKELQECAGRLRAVLRPAWRYVAARLPGEENVKQKEADEGTTAADFGRERLILPGRSIENHLAGCEMVLCACLTLGAEVDKYLERLQRESMLSALLFDALANAAVERLRGLLEERAAADFPKLRPNWLFGIGYGDLPLALQRDVLRLTRAEEELGLGCSESLMLIPTKSVTGFLGMLPKEARRAPDADRAQSPLEEAAGWQAADGSQNPHEEAAGRQAADGAQNPHDGTARRPDGETADNPNKKRIFVSDSGWTDGCGKGSCAVCGLRGNCEKRVFYR